MTMTIDQSKCMAKIKRKGEGGDEYCQCSRSKKKGRFCITHYKQSLCGLLKHGEYNDQQREARSTRVSKRKTSAEIQAEILDLDAIGQFLFDPITKWVYDMKTQCRIGHLVEDDEDKFRVVAA